MSALTRADSFLKRFAEIRIRWFLFDEIEKAPGCFQYFATGAGRWAYHGFRGRKVSFKNTVIIMTSNAGAQRIVEPKNLGFAAKEDAQKTYEKMKAGVMEEVKRLFKPEF